MTDVVKKSSIGNGYQTAIDKVKQNEALTHPKQHEKLMQQKLKMSMSSQSPSSPNPNPPTNNNPELQNMKNTKNNGVVGGGRHMSIITVADANDNKSKDKGGSSLSSGMVSSRLSMDYRESLIRKKNCSLFSDGSRVSEIGFFRIPGITRKMGLRQVGPTGFSSFLPKYWHI